MQANKNIQTKKEKKKRGVKIANGFQYVRYTLANNTEGQGALGNLIEWMSSLPRAGVGTGWSLRSLPFQPQPYCDSHSIVLIIKLCFSFCTVNHQTFFGGVRMPLGI